MDAVNFLKAEARLCEGCGCCSECPIGEVKGTDYCDDWMFENPTEAVAIVEKWSEEHPERIGDVEQWM